jgi:hypothetical protein
VLGAAFRIGGVCKSAMPLASWRDVFPAPLHQLAKGLALGKFQMPDKLESNDPPKPLARLARGIKGAALRPVRSEADHFRVCFVCGQSLDMRDIDQVLHHGLGPHDPLPIDG